MPQRKDAYYRRQKEDVRNCPKHKVDYSPKWGCQKCHEERMALLGRRGDGPQLQPCPKCKKESLAWYQQTQRYECMNRKCKIAYAEEEYRAATRISRTPRKCPKCKKETYHWNESTSSYECTNAKCKDAPSPKE